LQRRKQFRIHLIGLVGSSLIYLIGTPVLYPYAGTAALSLAVLPAMVAGWGYGLRAGLLASALMALINFVLLLPVDAIALDRLLWDVIPISGMVVLVGMVTGYLHDSRERLRLAHAALQNASRTSEESEERYRKAIVAAGAVPYFRDYQKNTYSFMGADIIKITGYTADELTPTLLDSLVDDIHLSGELGKLPPEEALRRTRTGMTMEWKSDIRITTRTGMTRWVHDASVQVLDEEGNVIGSVGILQDVTERKRTEEALRESEEGLRQLVNTAFESFAIHDAGTIMEVNEAFCRMFGYERYEVIGKSLLELTAPDFREFVHEKIASGDTRAYEGAAVHKGGTRFYVEIVSKPIMYRGRNARITALMDVTERKLAEAQHMELALANQKAQILKEFLNTLSHDLKTPLSVINTSLYLLERATDPVNQKQRVAQIKAQAHHLEKLIQDILMASRLDTVPNLSFRQLDLNKIVRAVQAQFQSTAEQQALDLRAELDADLPPVLASEDELQRALLNLVENAVRYTPSGGKVAVRTYCANHEIVVEIADTGIGIDSADQAHVFDHFYRADKARATNTGGTGLGLAIVKRIVEMHAGTIDLESAPGKGSTFRVRLPIIVAIDGEVL
jgi:PAS domain S-box-containing protein